MFREHCLGFFLFLFCWQIKYSAFPQVSVTVRETVRKTAPAAVAKGLWCVASVSAPGLTLDSSASWTKVHFLHQMIMAVVQARMPLCAVVGGSA